MAEVTLVNARRVPAIAEERKGKEDYLVIYTVNKGPAQFVRCPAEGFSLDVVKRKIEETLKQTGGIAGQSFTL